MFSRLVKSKIIPLTITSIYGTCAVLAVANLAVNGSTFTGLDLGLTIAGVVPWVAAASHSLYRRIQARRKKVADDRREAAGEEPAPKEKEIVRISTHAAINSSLHMSAASFFIAGDAIYLSNIVPNPAGGPSTAILATRTAGSGLWLFSASIYLLTAVTHDRKKEDHPDEVASVLGVPAEVANLAGEALYLGAGILYAYAIYTSEVLNPIKATSNTLWLVANSMGTLMAVYDLANRPKPKKRALQMPGAHELAERSLATMVAGRPTGP